MTARRLLALLLCLTFLAPAARADEAPPVPGPRDLPSDEEPAPETPDADDAAETADDPKVVFDPADFELLPVDDLERIRLARAERGLVARLQVLARREGRLEEQLARRKDKTDDGARKLRKEIRRVAGQIEKMSGKALEAMRPYGVDEAALERIAAVPEGPYRIERFAHTLVLSLDLDDGQRALFERVVTEVNGAYLTLLAQRKRLKHHATQAELEPDTAAGITRGVDRQIRQMDKRFWRLVDYALSEGQRFALKERLPTKFTRVAGAIEHLYGLPGLTPAQGTRLKAILKEIEAETAPDQALVKRHQTTLRAGGLANAERKALQREIRAAHERMQDLQLWSAKTMKGILTEAQVRAYKAIPPRISANERRWNVKRVLEGIPLDGDQRKALAAIQREVRRTTRALRREVAEIRRKGTDYGPDSPQMGMMEMQMAGVQAEGQALQREALGRVFLEILHPAQTSGWVLGFYGRMR